MYNIIVSLGHERWSRLVAVSLWVRYEPTPRNPNRLRYPINCIRWLLPKRKKVIVIPTDYIFFIVIPTSRHIKTAYSNQVFITNIYLLYNNNEYCM